MAIPARSSLVFAACLLVSCTPGDREERPGTAPTREGPPGRGAFAPEPREVRRADIGQTIYVPAYSSIPTADAARPFNLAVTLSVRNTDQTQPIVIATVRYHDANGQLVREFLTKPVRLMPLASKDFFVKESDTSGGTSASFLVEWVAERPVSVPIVEAVMIGVASSQGISFLSTGRVVAERAR